MSRFLTILTVSTTATALVALASVAIAAEGELNLYSSRHYDTDERFILRIYGCHRHYD